MRFDVLNWLSFNFFLGLSDPWIKMLQALMTSCIICTGLSKISYLCWIFIQTFHMCYICICLLNILQCFLVRPTIELYQSEGNRYIRPLYLFACVRSYKVHSICAYIKIMAKEPFMNKTNEPWGNGVRGEIKIGANILQFLSKTPTLTDGFMI